jgi:hypothetical protein
LIVLVHGFRGNQFDMRLLQVIIKSRYPSTTFLCSAANEDNTDGDIEVMGMNLAKEVDRHLEEKDNHIGK